MMIRSMPPASAHLALMPVPAPPPMIGRPADTWERSRCKHWSRVKKLMLASRGLGIFEEQRRSAAELLHRPAQHPRHRPPAHVLRHGFLPVVWIGCAACSAGSLAAASADRRQCNRSERQCKAPAAAAPRALSRSVAALTFKIEVTAPDASKVSTWATC